MTNRSQMEKWSLGLARLWQDARLRQLVVIGSLVAVISYYYAFLASAGTFEMVWPRPNFYDRMCEGFRAGHLYIVEQPKAALLAQEDPFAHVNFRRGLWLWDASLYREHYYVYWGPVPALLLLVWKVITGYEGPVTDQWSAVIYMIGRLLFGTGLLLGLARALRVRPSTWLVALATAVFGLSSPVPFTVARPDVYEASLAAGQCFLFAGLLSCFYGIIRPRFRTSLFVLAGVAWGLAFGSRMTTILGVPFFVVPAVYLVWQNDERSYTRAFKNTLSMGLPVFLAVVAYGIYNYLRFESPFEFGLRYQLTLVGVTNNTKYYLANAFSYLFAPVEWSCRFPFVVGQKDRPLSQLIHWPKDYATYEIMGGMLSMGGFCWLQFLLVGSGIRGLSQRLRFWGCHVGVRMPFVYSWALAASLGLVVALVPVLGVRVALMRYSMDAIGGMVIAAAIAAFWLVRRSDDTGVRTFKVLVRVVVLALGMHSCFVGAISAFHVPVDYFKRYNAELYHRISSTLSICDVQE